MDGTTVERIAIDDITTDEATQQRERIDKEHVQNLAESLKDGAKLPPIRVFLDKSADTFWLSRGWHRYLAHKGRGLEHIEAEVLNGTLRDAVLDSVGDNWQHNALRRTNADKRKAVLRLLKDKEWSGFSDREIARRCTVDNSFVSRLHSELSVDEQQIADPERAVTREGTQYLMDTTNVGKSTKKNDKKQNSSAVKAAKPEPPKPPPVPLDKEDHPIPDRAAIRHAFAEAEDKFDAAIIGLSHIKGVVSRIPDTAAVRFNRQKTISEISSARSELSHGRPHSVCPYCGGNPKGTPCEACNGTGWVTKLTYEEAPQEMKAKLEVR